MEIVLSEELCRAIGAKALKPYGVDFDNFRWHGKRAEIDLSEYSAFKNLELRRLIEPHEKIRTAGVAIRDITTWIKSTKDSKDVKPRKLDQLPKMIENLLLPMARQWLYEKDAARNVWFPYWIGGVRYHPPETRSGWYSPPYVSMEMFYVEMGKRGSKRVSWHSDDVINKTISQILAQKDLVTETPEMFESYTAEKARYYAELELVGKQFLATGTATDDLDGNKKDDDHWWWKRTNTISLDRGGEPSRIVVDIIKEDPEEDDNEKDKAADLTFWWNKRKKRGKVSRDGDVEELDEEEMEEKLAEAVETEEFVPPEIPTHAIVPTFDLRKHLRLRVHIGQMAAYVYDPKIGDKLVMPEDDRALIEILLAQKGAFRDIIIGKGGGAIILCAGPPGTGKTLTAEAYAEVTGRPLYTVQCSQLGTSPDDLESELLKTFARAERWNAILLLDEADVYVAERGKDLTQNAIVGVFLRVLEYYKGVMFLTTNRADLVDDAVLSRCIARIEYKIPTLENQIRIWQILSETAGVPLKDAEIRKFAKAHPELSGRDVKNLLKLGALISAARGKPLDATLLEFVKRFKPTFDAVKER